MKTLVAFKITTVVFLLLLLGINSVGQNDDIPKFVKETCECFAKINADQNLTYSKIKDSRRSCVVSTLSNNSILFRSIELRNKYISSLNCLDIQEAELYKAGGIDLPKAYSIPDPFVDVVLWDLIEDIQKNVEDVKRKFNNKSIRFEGYLSDIIEKSEDVLFDIRGFERKGSKLVLQTVFDSEELGFAATGYNGAALCELGDIPNFVRKINREYSYYYGKDVYTFNETDYKIMIEGDISKIDSEVRSTQFGPVKIYRISLTNCFVTEVNNKQIVNNPISDSNLDQPIVKEVDKTPNENVDNGILPSQSNEENITFYKIEDPDGYTNMRTKPGGDIIRKVLPNEKFEVIGIDNNYKIVKFLNGETGYIHQSRVVKFQ